MFELRVFLLNWYWISDLTWEQLLVFVLDCYKIPHAIYIFERKWTSEVLNYGCTYYCNSTQVKKLANLVAQFWRDCWWNSTANFSCAGVFTLGKKFGENDPPPVEKIAFEVTSHDVVFGQRVRNPTMQFCCQCNASRIKVPRLDHRGIKPLSSKNFSMTL
jgi:hypothetical protein